MVFVLFTANREALADGARQQTASVWIDGLLPFVSGGLNCLRAWDPLVLKGSQGVCCSMTDLHSSACGGLLNQEAWMQASGAACVGI